MINFGGAESILESDHLKVQWQFILSTANGTRSYWSTKNIDTIGNKIQWGEGVVETDSFGFADSMGFSEDRLGDFEPTIIQWESGVMWDGEQPQTSAIVQWETGGSGSAKVDTFGFGEDEFGFGEDETGYDITTAGEEVFWEQGVQWEVGNTGPAYAFGIIDFDGVQLSRPISEAGLQVPSTTSFSLINKDYEYNFMNYINGEVWITLYIEDAIRGIVFGRWRFAIKSTEPAYQKIRFKCEDYYSQYMEGDYPNTKLIKDIFPSNDPDASDDVCVPIPFGSCYIPLRSVYITNQRYYLLGPIVNKDGDAVTYSITNVRSPRNLGLKNEFSSGSYSFTQSTQVDSDGNSWRVFQPILVDSDWDGIADTIGLWQSGDSFQDMPTNFSRSDLASISDPGDIIDFVWKDFGINVNDIDSNSITTASATYSSWGLTFVGGLRKKIQRQQTMAMLLNSCHSTYISGEKISLQVLSKTSQATITSVVKKQEKGEGTFRYSATNTKLSDSANVAWQQTGESQDEFIKTLVPAKSSTNYISGEILQIPFVQNSIHNQNLGSLVFQRKFLRQANISFTEKANRLPLRPDDVITISGNVYGGTYDVLIDSMMIHKDVSIDFRCIKFSDDLDDWEDLSFSAITVASDNTVGSMAPLIMTDSGIQMVKTGAGTLTILPYQNDALADDGIVNLPTTTDGWVHVSCNAEAGYWSIQSDGTVTKIAGTVNTAATDSDTNLCVYQSGTQAIVKNRLGASGKIRIEYHYN